MTETSKNDISETTDLVPEALTPATTRQRSWLLIVAAVVIVLDQFSKLMVEATLPLYQSWAPIPAIESIFRISHTSNTGASFGLFPNGSSIFAWAAVLVAIGIIAYNYGLPSGQTPVRIALGFQLGGALGNFIDRMRLGHVTDFLDFGPWPVFNVADMSIVGGAIFLAWLLWQEERQQKQSAEPTAADTDSGNQPPGIVKESNTLDEWSTN